MLFTRKNFRQYFSVHPNRRRATYSVPAHVQTLDSKILLSATTVDTSTDDSSTDDTSTADGSTADGSTTDSSTTDSSTTDGSTTDSSTTDSSTVDSSTADTSTANTSTTDNSSTAGMDDVSIEDAMATVIVGETQIDGYLYSFEGDYSGMTISFGGVLSGPDVAIYPDGTIFAMFDGELSGLAVLTLKDSSGTVLDQYSMFI